MVHESEEYPLDREHSKLKALREAVRRAEERMEGAIDDGALPGGYNDGLAGALAFLREETAPHMGEGES